MKNSMHFRHVFFGSLPIRATFCHQGFWYLKTSENSAHRLGTDLRWHFQVHYGAIIHKEYAEQLGLQEERNPVSQALEKIIIAAKKQVEG